MDVYSSNNCPSIIDIILIVEVTFVVIADYNSINYC